MEEINASCSKQVLTSPEKKTVIHVVAKRQPFYIERYYLYEGEKIEAPNLPYRIFEKTGNLDSFGNTTVLLPMVPKKCEIEFVPGICAGDIDGELTKLYEDLDKAIELCSNEFRTQFNTAQKKIEEKNKTEPVDPKLLEARKKLRDEIEALINDLKERQKAYEDLSFLGKSWENAKAVGSGIGTGVVEYLPDLGDMGKWMDELDISSLDMMQAIYTGDIKDIKKKLDAWKGKSDESAKEAIEAMETVLLLISDEETRKRLLKLPERMLEVTPTDELVEIGMTQSTQWGMDAAAVSGSTVACGAVSGPGGVVCGAAAFGATSARKVGKVLEPISKVLAKLAKKIKQKRNKESTTNNKSEVPVENPRNKELIPFIKFTTGRKNILYVNDKIRPAEFELGIEGKGTSKFEGNGELQISGNINIYSDANCTNELKNLKFSKKELTSKKKPTYFIKPNKKLNKAEKIEMSLRIKGDIDVKTKRR